MDCLSENDFKKDNYEIGCNRYFDVVDTIILNNLYKYILIIHYNLINNRIS